MFLSLQILILMEKVALVEFTRVLGGQVVGLRVDCFATLTTPPTLALS